MPVPLLYPPSLLVIPLVRCHGQYSALLSSSWRFCARPLIAQRRGNRMRRSDGWGKQKAGNHGSASRTCTPAGIHVATAQVRAATRKERRRRGVEKRGRNEVGAVWGLTRALSQNSPQGFF
jgi:hypothetical protein